MKCPFREQRPCDEKCAISVQDEEGNKKCAILDIRDNLVYANQLSAAIGQVVKSVGEKTLAE